MTFFLFGQLTIFVFGGKWEKALFFSGRLTLIAEEYFLFSVLLPCVRLHVPRGCQELVAGGAPMGFGCVGWVAGFRGRLPVRVQVGDWETMLCASTGVPGERGSGIEKTPPGTQDLSWWCVLGQRTGRGSQMNSSGTLVPFYSFFVARVVVLMSDAAESVTCCS